VKKFVAVVFLTLGLAACSFQTSPSQSISESKGSQSPTVEVPVCDVSPLTNECYETTNPVLLVKIDDVVEARPQVGLNISDVIVVEPVEAGLTRLMAVFNSEFPETVGPIRSARITDIDIAAAFGSPGFAYSGSTSKLVPYLTESNLQLVGAPQGGQGYFRVSDRYAPHNYFATVSELISRISDTSTAKLTTSKSWRFGDLLVDGKSPISIEVVYASARKEFIWNSEIEKWEIWADGTQTFTVNEQDELEPATTSTVFIQQTRLLDSPFVFSSGTVTPYAETYGEGKGWVLSRGQSFYGTWQRAELSGLPRWFDKNGNEIGIADGNVWWVVAPYDESEINVKLPKPKPAATSTATAKPKS
jgi:hypothetical protein